MPDAAAPAIAATAAGLSSRRRNGLRTTHEPVGGGPDETKMRMLVPRATDDPADGSCATTVPEGTLAEGVSCSEVGNPAACSDTLASASLSPVTLGTVRKTGRNRAGAGTTDRTTTGGFTVSPPGNGRFLPESKAQWNTAARPTNATTAPSTQAGDGRVRRLGGSGANATSSSRFSSRSRSS